MKTLEQMEALMKEALAADLGEFRPCAFFDDRLDCIRIIARDCSVLEERINEGITVLVDNYYPGPGRKRRYVGFTIKGARHFCQEHRLSLTSPIKMTELLDAIMASFPDEVVQMFVDFVAKPLVAEEKIDEVEIPDDAILQPA
jgi:hypothetical protein